MPLHGKKASFTSPSSPLRGETIEAYAQGPGLHLLADDAASNDSSTSSKDRAEWQYTWQSNTNDARLKVTCRKPLFSVPTAG